MLGYGPALIEILAGLWERFDGTPIQVVGSGQLSAVAAPTVVSTVPIEGGWDGALTLTLATELAWRLAIQRYQTDEPSDQNIVDLLAELTTELASEFTVMLPGQCRLGLPTVRGAHGFRVLVPGFAHVLNEDFQAGGAGVAAAVFQRRGSPPVG